MIGRGRFITLQSVAINLGHEKVLVAAAPQESEPELRPPRSRPSSSSCAAAAPPLPSPRENDIIDLTGDLELEPSARTPEAFVAPGVFSEDEDDVEDAAIDQVIDEEIHAWNEVRRSAHKLQHDRPVITISAETWLLCLELKLKTRSGID